MTPTSNTRAGERWTPGPWFALPAKPGLTGLRDRLICAESQQAWTHAIARDGGKESETDANARLIAAAPALYEALREILKRRDSPVLVNAGSAVHAELCEIANIARAALSLATEGK